MKEAQVAKLPGVFKVNTPPEQLWKTMTFLCIAEQEGKPMISTKTKHDKSKYDFESSSTVATPHSPSYTSVNLTRSISRIDEREKHSAIPSFLDNAASSSSKSSASCEASVASGNSKPVIDRYYRWQPPEKPLNDRYYRWQPPIRKWTFGELMVISSLFFMLYISLCTLTVFLLFQTNTFCFWKNISILVV